MLLVGVQGIVLARSVPWLPVVQSCLTPRLRWASRTPRWIARNWGAAMAPLVPPLLRLPHTISYTVRY